MITRKTLTLFIVLTIGVTSISSGLSVSSADYAKSQISEQTKWSFLLYCDTDYGQNADAIGPLIINQLETVGSNDELDILVLWDRQDGGALAYHVTEDNSYDITSEVIDDLGEVNIGNYIILRDFILRAKTDYPAEKYMLMLFDHGGAWQGACWDAKLSESDTDNITWEDHLTMDEMQMALNESGGVNIIGFSACVMGCIESAYELRNYTEIYFGSEEMNGCGQWPWTDILQILSNDFQESTYSISEKIMDAFKEQHPYFGEKGYWINQIEFAKYYHRLLPWLNPPSFTMSAVRSDKIDGLALAMDNFANVLIENIGFYKKDINRARLRSEDFPMSMSLLPPMIMGNYVDIYHFANLMSKPLHRISRPDLYDAAQNVKTCIDEAIMGEHHQIGHRHAHGLTVYFPPKNSKYHLYDNLYSNCGLDFVENTKWDEFLELYLFN